VNAPLVSVIVLNYNGASFLPDCLGSLLDQDWSPLEVLVVDNASTDISEQVTADFPVRFIRLPTNDGLGPGYNEGAREAKGDLLFFINNDMRFDRACVGELARVFLRASDILATDPMQYSWKGDHVIHGVQKIRRDWCHVGFAIPFVRSHCLGMSDRSVEVPWGCAGAMMFDRAKFEAMGGFDSTFFLDYEDVDICWRGWLRSWRTVFVPTAEVYHHAGAARTYAEKVDPKFRERYLLSQVHNAQRFVLKTMNAGTITSMFLITAGKICAHFLVGRPHLATLIAKATWTNLRNRSEIRAARRAVLDGANVNSHVLLRRFLLDGKRENR